MPLVKENYFFERAALGLVAGVKQVLLYGSNAAISTSSETLWSPGATYAQLTSAVAFEAISSSANDTSAGTGVRTIEVDLVDGNFTETTVSVTLNGTSAVAITGTYIACNGMRALTAGSGAAAAGTIDIRTVSGSVVKSRIATGDGQSSCMFYTVPANRRGLLTMAAASGSGITGEPELAIRVYDSTGMLMKIAGACRAGFSATGLTNAQCQINFGAGLYIPEKCLVEARVISVGGSAGAVVGNAELYVFDWALGG